MSSSDRAETISFPLAFAKLPPPQKSQSVEPESAASQWVDAFNKASQNLNEESLSFLFLKDSYWRDQLCLSWDLHTLHGPESYLSLINKAGGLRIKSFALDTSTKGRSPALITLDLDGNISVVGAFLTIETTRGKGSGFVRLVFEDDKWKAFTLFTSLHEIDGNPEKSGLGRPHGLKERTGHQNRNWLEERQDEDTLQSSTDGHIPVLIIGAGQAGLTVGARLKVLNVKTLIIDTTKNVGDSWRNRYHQLVLHDPVWYDHLPYLPFPPTWPVFTPKDKLAGWFEAYAQAMELTVWNETSLQSAQWSEESKTWEVAITRGSATTRTFKVDHIIQATGASGEPNFPSTIPGLDTFKGTKIIHSSQFKGVSPSSQNHNKKAIVVGSCNSAQDIAQNYYKNGYSSVTMIQRSSSCVVSAETMRKTLSGLYGEGAPPTEEADILAQSLPYQVAKSIYVDVTKWQNEQDQEIISGLKSVGFKLDNGPDESGLFLKYIQHGGGYYLDVGSSTLIAEGKIAVKHGSVDEILPTGLKLSSGEVIEADEIVFATGYRNMTTQTEKIFGKEVADKVRDVWGFDEEGEIRTMWRKSGHEGLWMMGGNLALCRWYSRVLALQIKGLIEGVYGYDDI